MIDNNTSALKWKFYDKMMQYGGAIVQSKNESNRIPFGFGVSFVNRGVGYKPYTSV